MKKTQAKISLYELTQIANQRDLILKAFANPRASEPVSSTSAHEAASPQSIMNFVNENYRGSTPPFLLYFEIFNFNVHNSLVDFGASTNVMPLSVCKKINIRPEKTDAKIIQLDRSQVLAMGELNNILIHLSSDSRVHQCIDIVIVDIPEAYGFLLGLDWSSKLQGYFATDWSHLWLPYKGKNNQIWVESEPYMKHMATDLEATNEPVRFAEEELGMCFLEAAFCFYQTPQSSITQDTQS